MPRGSPFTALCQNTAKPQPLARADLHLHSNHSDGLYTVDQLVNLGRRAGLQAMALTDHDTLSGWDGFSRSARTAGLEPVCGVEITCSLLGVEIHLLGLGVDPSHAGLVGRLDQLRLARLNRYRGFLDRLETLGLGPFDEHWREIQQKAQDHPGMTIGRRNLALHLVSRGKAPSIRIAFERWLATLGRECGDEARVPASEAIELIQASGGISSWAHPPEREFDSHFSELLESGLDAIEAEYPDFKNRRIRELKRLAQEQGLLVTGGSDCHGPGPRFPGSTSLCPAEWGRLKARLSGRHVSSAL